MRYEGAQTEARCQQHGPKRPKTHRGGGRRAARPNMMLYRCTRTGYRYARPFHCELVPSRAHSRFTQSWRRGSFARAINTASQSVSLSFVAVPAPRSTPPVHYTVSTDGSAPLGQLTRSTQVLSTLRKSQLNRRARERGTGHYAHETQKEKSSEKCQMKQLEMGHGRGGPRGCGNL